MKITRIILFVLLLSACNLKNGQKENVSQNHQKDHSVDALKKANISSTSKTDFKLDCFLQSESGDTIGMVQIKPLLDNKDVFSSLIITGHGSFQNDTLYSIKGFILSNSKGIDTKVSDQNLYGYRFVSKHKDSFMILALYDNGKGVSDNIWIRWNYKTKIFEVFKV